MAEKKTKTRGRGPGRTTREDWIRTALDSLISEGVEAVKVASLAEKLDCARSSFYWFFQNRDDLLDSLLDHWQATNTRAVVEAAGQPAESVNRALGALYAGWLVGGRFDTRLDFAIRDWARRSGTVRRAVDISDAERIAAIAAMFAHFGFPASEADVRARTVYFTQIGYDALDQRESWEARLLRIREYLLCMTGQSPTDEDLNHVRASIRKKMGLAR